MEREDRWSSARSTAPVATIWSLSVEDELGPWAIAPRARHVRTLAASATLLAPMDFRRVAVGHRRRILNPAESSIRRCLAVVLS
jgi:hypothetical protein